MGGMIMVFAHPKPGTAAIPLHPCPARPAIVLVVAPAIRGAMRVSIIPTRLGRNVVIDTLFIIHFFSVVLLVVVPAYATISSVRAVRIVARASDVFVRYLVDIVVRQHVHIARHENESPPPDL